MSRLSKGFRHATKQIGRHKGGIIGGATLGPVGALLGHKLLDEDRGGSHAPARLQDTDIGKMAARGQLLGAFPELAQAFDAAGIQHANPIPLTFNRKFGNQLLGNAATEQARAGEQGKSDVMAQLSSSGLLGSGQRVGFERDFAAQQANQRYETIANLMIEARQSRRAEKLEAISGFLASIGQANEANVLAQQAESIRKDIQAKRKAAQLLPISLAIEGLGALGNAAGAIAGAV